MPETFAKRLSIALSLLFTYCSVSLAQDKANPFVRLATYWDAPGFVDSVSVDDRWIVVYDSNPDLSRLVEVATGHVLVTNKGDHTIRFSAHGQFASIKAGENRFTQIFDLNTQKITAEVPGVFAQFSDDDTRIMVDNYDRDAKFYTTKVVDTTTGKVKLTVDGRGTDLNAHGEWVVVEDTSRLMTTVYDTISGKAVFEFPTQDYQDGQERNTTSYFSPDGTLLSIYQANNLTAYMIDTQTWQMLYKVVGFVTFSPDSRFLKSRGDDGPASGIRLYEARTGKQIDKVYGEMWFSEDGKLLFRSDATNCAYRGYMQVIDLSTMAKLMDIQKCVGLEAVEDAKIVEIYDEDITAPQVHQFIELATGTVLWQVEAWDADMIDYEQRLVIVSQLGRQIIENFETGEVFATERQITPSDSHKLAFTSNGLLVDVYGATDLRVDTMPAPRVGGGIVQAAEGVSIQVFSKPNSGAPVVEGDDRNPTRFYVMGKSADEKWLYVTYSVLGTENRRKEGWIVNGDQLTVIEDWHDVPVLSGDDPLAELQAKAG